MKRHAYTTAAGAVQALPRVSTAWAIMCTSAVLAAAAVSTASGILVPDAELCVASAASMAPS
jgi:hypothetical protein